jgi:hypothetical protein
MQVSTLETSASKPSMTRRKSLDAIKTGGVLFLRDKSAGHLITGQTMAGVKGA